MSKKRIKLAFSVLILTLALPACSSDDAGKKQETELTEDELAKIGADFTIDSIKSAMDKINNAISGDEGYKKAYAELAKTELSENEGLRFKLIYVDDDDIYYSISETGEVEEDCYRKGFNYDDLDGDGVPSEEEERLAQVCILTEYGFC